MKAFSTAFTRGLPHGILAAVHLPEPSDHIPDKVLRRLHADERAHAETLTGKRRVEWVGGRLAARLAASALSCELSALLTDEFGAPTASKSLCVSISHKNGLAIALVARRSNGAIGVDLEVPGRDRAHIASKILLPSEQEDIEGLADDRRWNAVLLRFGLKEAIYKALAPTHRRYIGFEEAEISKVSNGHAEIKLLLKSGPNPKEIDARYDWMPEGLVTSVRVRWD